MIEAHDLTRRFGKVVAVDRVSLRVPDGAILALLGPNGAGKTTTVRMLAGLLAPDDGDATVAECDVRTDPAGVRARVGLVTDTPGLYEQMTLPSYLDFFGALYGLPADRRGRRVDELISFFDLAGHRAERMVGFSKGMKQKVALARALLHEPAALFLDEPTAGLDPLAAKAVRDLIVGLKHASRSIILCTHDLDEAERLADEIVILRQGRIVASDAPAALRAGGSSDTRVRIELAEPCPGALSALAGLAEAEGVTLTSGSVETGATVLEYRTRRARDVNPEVIARLVGAGARIVSVVSELRSLEDVYALALGGESDRLDGRPIAEPGSVPMGDIT
ncbi:MAG: ABC transporter ATP-binding protein [Chloroflexota bacterium]